MYGERYPATPSSEFDFNVPLTFADRIVMRHEADRITRRGGSHGRQRPSNGEQADPVSLHR
jgi:hypothetical protein